MSGSREERVEGTGDRGDTLVPICPTLHMAPPPHLALPPAARGGKYKFANECAVTRSVVISYIDPK